MTNTAGVYIQGRRIDTGDCSGPKSARNVLLHPDVDAAVLETARGGLLREGLAFDRCQVAVVTNLGNGDHLGLNYITTWKTWRYSSGSSSRISPPRAWPCSTPPTPWSPPWPVTVQERSPSSQTPPHNPVIAAHRAQGQRVVYTEAGALVAAQGEFEYRIPLAGIPVTLNGAIGFQVDNVMASVAVAWAPGLPWDRICLGLAGFRSDADTVPGRSNCFDYQGASIIADYGHNPDAIHALVRAVEAMPARRRCVVISGAGDRRDQDIRAQTRLLGEAFDTVLLYQDQCQRGRADGEVLALLRQGLANATRTRDVEEIRGEFVAMDSALNRLAPGDLCLILVDQVEEALAHIKARIAERA